MASTSASTRSTATSPPSSSRETRFRRLAEELPLVTYIDAPLGTTARSGEMTDRSPGESLYLSPQAEDLFGYPVEDWKDNLLWERILHPDDRERVIDETLEAQRTFAPLTLEYRVSTGRRVALCGSATPPSTSSTRRETRSTSRASSWT